MNGDVLVLNSGSSSIKFGLYDGDDAQLPLLGQGRIEGIGAAIQLRAFDGQGRPLVDQRFNDGLDHGQAMTELADWLRHRKAARDIAAVGHRVVHGGTRFHGPVKVDSAVYAELEKLNPLAPLHQPHSV